MRPRARALLRAGQIAVALVLVALLLRSASPAALWAMRDRIDLRLWLAALALLFLMHLLGAVALLVLTGRGRASLTRLLVGYGHVQAIALFTPAQAGEALLPLLFARAGVDGGETTAALIVQRVVGLAITAAAAALFAAGKLPAAALPLLALALAAGLLGIGLLIRSRRLRTRLPRVGAFLESVERSARRMAREHRAGLALHVALMVVRFAVAVAASWAMCLSFAIDAPFLEIAGLSAAGTVATLVPLSPAGLGITEGIFLAGLRSRGFAPEQILGACLAGRLLTVALLGSFALIYSATPWREDQITRV
jgi:uncharacterized membrane protein YbhN (UPF0104 family)